MTNKPKSERHIKIRAVRRAKPDYRKLGRALLMFAEAQRNKEAMEAHARQNKKRGAKDA